MNEQETQEIRRYLNVIKRAVSLVEGLLDNGDGGTLEALMQEQRPQVAQPAAIPNIVFQTAPAQSSPEPQQVAVVEAKVVEAEHDEEQYKARQKHISELMAIDCWPEAVPELLARKEPTEKEKNKRANMMIDLMVDRKLEGLKFLDFGCGEGHVAEQMKLRGVAKSIGYDIEKKDTWDNFKNAQLTTSFNDLTNGELFDMIMLYDVLDHSEDPEDVMKKVKSLLTKTGVVYVRCHPWTACHAHHLHLLNPELNKAYLHLFLSWQEIYEITDKKPMYTRKELKPQDAYHWWFKQFDIKRERVMDNPNGVSEFFHVPAFKELLAHEQGVDMDDIDGFLKLMNTQFIDYILVPK